MPELTTYSSPSSSSLLRPSMSSVSEYRSEYKPYSSSSSSLSSSSYLTHKSRSSYDVTGTRNYSTLSHRSTASDTTSSGIGSSLYSPSLSYYRNTGVNRNYLGLSSNPCSVTLTRYNPRRSSLDYNDSDTDSLCSTKSITSSTSSYLYSPLSRRRKYSLKSDECNGLLSKLPVNVCGLTNLGNTCYMNSVLQALYATHIFKSYVMKYQRHQLMASLSNLFRDMESSENSTFSPTAFRSQFTRYQPKFRGYDQQDAQEFLRYLITGLHEEVNEARNKPKSQLRSPQSPDEAWRQYRTIDDSPFIDMLGGQLSSVIECTQCGNTSTCWDPFWDLSLPLPRHKSECTVEECLREFTALEELSPGEHPICERCKRQTQSTKQLSIERAPPVLILHLKRFSNEGYKLSIPRVVPDDKLLVKNRYYTLYAIVSHHGSSSRSGHYTSYCLHNGKWYLFNDERVSEMKNFSPSDISDAYILFYMESSYSSRL